MVVMYLGSDKSVISQCDAVFESFVEDLPESEGARVVVNKKVTMTDIG